MPLCLLVWEIPLPYIWDALKREVGSFQSQLGEGWRGPAVPLGPARDRPGPEYDHVSALDIWLLLFFGDHTTRHRVLSTNAIYMSEHEQRICEPSMLELWKLPW